MSRCIDCKHFVPHAHYPAGSHPDMMHRGTCVEAPVWQSIGNGVEHYCGRWTIIPIKRPRVERLPDTSANRRADAEAATAHASGYLASDHH